MDLIIVQLQLKLHEKQNIVIHYIHMSLSIKSIMSESLDKRINDINRKLNNIQTNTANDNSNETYVQSTLYDINNKLSNITDQKDSNETYDQTTL